VNSEQLLDIFKDEISVEFFTKQQELISKDRLNFATYDSEKSQLEYLESQINDCKDFLRSLKYPYTEIAMGFIRFDSSYGNQLSVEDELIQICSNLILNELEESFEQLIQQGDIEPTIEELDKISDLVYQNEDVVKLERVIEIAARIDRQQNLESLINEVQIKPIELPNTFCKSMPLRIPREHFKKLTTEKSKNGHPFLTNEQLDLFIERAFCGNTTIPKQKINKANREKLLVQSLFYDFYNNYCMDYFSTMQCQDDFIKLLTDNFEGWDFQNVKNNFTPKTKKRL
jgi:hypothetical protein